MIYFAIVDEIKNFNIRHDSIYMQRLYLEYMIGSECGSDGVLCTGEACSEYRCGCTHVPPRHSSSRAKQVG